MEILLNNTQRVEAEINYFPNLKDEQIKKIFSNIADASELNNICKINMYRLKIDYLEFLL